MGGGSLCTSSKLNLNGRGVRVLVLGDKGKGVAELFDGESVRHEEWWNKKYMPSLVKTRYVVYFRVALSSVLTALIAMVLSTLTRPSPVSWASRRSWSLV